MSWLKHEVVQKFIQFEEFTYHIYCVLTVTKPGLENLMLLSSGLLLKYVKHTGGINFRMVLSRTLSKSPECWSELFVCCRVHHVARLLSITMIY